MTPAGETAARGPLAVLEEIRRTVQAATPPPWTLETQDCDCGGEDPCGHGSYPYAIRTSEPHVTRPEGTPNADYDFVHGEICELTCEDVEFIVAARKFMPRLLAIPCALLKAHQPGRFVIAGETCKHHEVHRHFSIDGNEAASVRDCPDCTATVYRQCTGCPVPVDHCTIRSAIAAALSGEEVPS